MRRRDFLSLLAAVRPGLSPPRQTGRRRLSEFSALTCRSFSTPSSKACAISATSKDKTSSTSANRCKASSTLFLRSPRNWRARELNHRDRRGIKRPRHPTHGAVHSCGVPRVGRSGVAGMVASLAHSGGAHRPLLNRGRFRRQTPRPAPSDGTESREVSVFYVAGAGKGTTFDSAERTAQKLGIQVRAADRDRRPARARIAGACECPFRRRRRPRPTLLERQPPAACRLAEKYRLPAIYPSAEFARAGGLMAYGPVFVDMGRRGAVFVDKIIKGADPGGIRSRSRPSSP